MQLPIDLGLERSALVLYVDWASLQKVIGRAAEAQAPSKELLP